MFDSLEFRVLRERLFQTLDAVTAEAESGFDVDGDVLSSAEVPAWLDEHVKAGERTGVNVVGQWARGTGDVRALAVATAGGRAAYLDVTSLDERAEQAVADWLADPSRPKALHDAKGPSHALAARGWELAGLTSDTALAAYLVKPDQRVFDLADLSLRMLHRELKNDTAPGGQGMLDFDGDQDAEAGEAMVVASAVLELADALDVELDRTGGTGLLRDVELPLVGVLAGMERSGIAVDVPALESLESDFDAQVREAQEDAWEAIDDRSINLGSPKQLQEVLFGRLNLPEDQAHQDRLHHRRRRAQRAGPQGRQPVPRLGARVPRRRAAAGHGRGAAQVGRRGPAGPHDLHPDHRRHRPAQLHRPEPAERPDPHRGGPPDPRDVHRRRRLRVADVGGLQPDRDAGHGPPVG